MPSRYGLHVVCPITPAHIHIAANMNLRVKLSTSHEMLIM